MLAPIVTPQLARTTSIPATFNGNTMSIYAMPRAVPTMGPTVKVVSAPVRLIGPFACSCARAQTGARLLASASVAMVVVFFLDMGSSARG